MPYLFFSNITNLTLYFVELKLLIKQNLILIIGLSVSYLNFNQINLMNITMLRSKGYISLTLH